MATVGQSRGEEICPRCRLGIKKDVRRCPHCGERLSATSKLPIYVGIIGLLALLFVAYLMIQTIEQSDQNADDDQTAQQPATPDKPPPSNK